MVDVQIVRNVEAILFAAAKRMTVEEIVELLPDTSAKDVLKALQALQEDLKKDTTSMCVIVDGETWKLSLKDKYLGFTESLMPTTELSRPVVETLAIIAWKSPVEQSEIVRLRSAAVYDHIAELFKLGLVTKSRKGRTYVLRVTNKFYEYFDMPQVNVDELLGQYEEPSEEELSTDTEFNKGDTFDETNDQRDKRLMEEIKSNTIDPETIIRKDKEFLNDFDARLHDIESRSLDAGQTLQSIDTSLVEDVESVTGITEHATGVDETTEVLDTEEVVDELPAIEDISEGILDIPKLDALDLQESEEKDDKKENRD
jgi:segregation and condensation protein B